MEMVKDNRERRITGKGRGQGKDENRERMRTGKRRG